MIYANQRRVIPRVLDGALTTMMTHTEGVLKTVELVGKENGDSHIYIEFIPYGQSIPEKLAIDAQSFLEKILLNEKIGMIVWEDEKLDDTVNIRGVGKDIPIIARYN